MGAATSSPHLVRYAGCGALAGAAVTAGLWVSVSAAPWVVALATGIGVAVGAELGVTVGSGHVKRAWEGAVGAVVLPALAIALLNVVVVVWLGSRAH